LARSLALSLLAALALLWTAGPARAEPAPEPDTELARRHFEAGLELYGATRYHEALLEFEMARALKPSPALDYNIGRCQERLEEWERAVEAYDRFVTATPQAAEALLLRPRLAVLRARALERHGHPRTLPPWGLATGLITGAWLLTTGAALGAYLSAWGDYRALQRSCAGQCVEAQLTKLRQEVGLAQGAGYALFAMSGALLAVDVVALIAWRRAARR
jgi:tetratricopeptide (TPR) repeat protein